MRRPKAAFGGVVQHADPSTRECEWCGEPASVAVGLEGKAGLGKFIYACHEHKHLAEQAKTAVKGR